MSMVGLGEDNAHVFNILETVPQIADEWVIDMLEHSTLADNVAHTF
jgi:hypothetical protein